ncbi:MAG: hypothetical protein ACLGI9_09080, partial [Thermoanaerobaculia bacterium]
EHGGAIAVFCTSPRELVPNHPGRGRGSGRGVTSLVCALDAEVWDGQLEEDARTGKLDALAEQVLRAHAAGHSTKLEPLRLTDDKLSG